MGTMPTPDFSPRDRSSITSVESISELQEIERQCIARFRTKAAQIKAEHPELSAQIGLRARSRPCREQRINIRQLDSGFNGAEFPQCH
jgi:hypothetical protein